MIIGRIAGRLNDENILAPDIFVNFHENLPVRETTHARVDQGQLDLIGYRLRKRAVRISPQPFHGVPRDTNVTVLFGANVAFNSELGKARSEEHMSELQSLMRI